MRNAREVVTHSACAGLKLHTHKSQATKQLLQDTLSSGLYVRRAAPLARKSISVRTRPDYSQDLFFLQRKNET
jgi:hypothetical protein